MNDFIIWFIVTASVIGTANDLLRIAKGENQLPKKEDGIKINWGLTIVLFLANITIKGFVGGAIGWVAIYYLNIPVIGAVVIAGIAGGQGDRIFDLLVNTLYKKVDKATGDIL